MKGTPDIMISIKENERIDATGFGDIKIIQDPEEFCYGVDSVILSDFAVRRAKNIREGSRIMDLGTGSGIIPLILSYKTKASFIRGVEIQESSWDRASRSIELNGLGDRLEFILTDILYVTKDMPEIKGSFDIVTSNPPYMPGSGGMKPETSAKTIARHETTAGLEDFIRVGSELLKERGEMFMVHRPSRLVDIFCLARKYRLEPKAVRMVLPRMGEEANIALIHMIKSGRPELSVLPPLIIHEKDGGFTKELEEAYI